MNVQAPPRPNGTLGRQDLGLGPRKRRVLEILEAYPGLNLDEVALALGVQRTAAKHHLHSLERLGLVTRVRQGRHLLHFPAQTPPIERAMLCLVRVSSVRRVAEALFVHPDRPRDRLAAELDLTTRTVRRAVRQLTRGGLARIQPSPAGPSIVLHPRLRVLLARQAGGAPPAAGGPEDIP